MRAFKRDECRYVVQVREWDADPDVSYAGWGDYSISRTLVEARKRRDILANQERINRGRNRGRTRAVRIIYRGEQIVE